MNCRDFREIIDSYLADELLTETNHGILRHLEECGDCRADIEGRRSVKLRLRNAVRSAPEFEISPAFETSLRAGLRKSRPEKRGWFSLIRTSGFRMAAASLLVILTVGILYSLRGGPDSTGPYDRMLLASTLPASHIVNVAASDHENCAVKHFSDKPSKQLNEVPESDRQLASTVSTELTGLLEDCELIDSHTCGFGEASFSHVVMKNGGKVLSVLVTEKGKGEAGVRGRVSRFASDKYSISRFDVRDRAVFVISQMDSEENARAAEAIYRPLELLYSGNASPDQFRTALLLAR